VQLALRESSIAALAARGYEVAACDRASGPGEIFKDAIFVIGSPARWCWRGARHSMVEVWNAPVALS